MRVTAKYTTFTWLSRDALSLAYVEYKGSPARRVYISFHGDRVRVRAEKSLVLVNWFTV